MVDELCFIKLDPWRSFPKYRQTTAPVHQTSLLVIPKEDLDGQPGVAANLETIRDRINLGQLLIRQAEVQSKVINDTIHGDALGEHTPSLLQTPDKKDLLRSLALGLGNLSNSVISIQRR